MCLELRQCHPKQLAGSVFLPDNVNHSPDDIRLLGSDVMVFMEVGSKVIEAGNAFYYHKFPITFTTTSFQSPMRTAIWSVS